MSCLAGPAGADPTGSKGRTIMANQARFVGGIDSHKDTIHVAVITELGVAVDDREFPTTTTGYRDATGWLSRHGSLTAVGVEGTSSYGAGIAAALLSCGVHVIEVNRTRPAERRKQGKTDQLDAYRAARAVVAGEATTEPKRASIESFAALCGAALRSPSAPGAPTGFGSPAAGTGPRTAPCT